MSEEAKRLAKAYGYECARNPHMNGRNEAKAALLAYIERIERERDEALEKAELSATRLVSECDRSEQKDKRIAELEAENARLREDAERYEYLRNPHNETYFLYQKDGFGGVELMSGPSLDDAIDEARKP